ncbi:hypothetical protein [Terrihabitans rhizophilus]|uniref:Uncharacterized protein n=1 Tax=Terrihabitans rhizophilus TaxID=3092662 RepID=A0ABU4RW90_9HYPH|nr:hypothetical protein [Terrihabitans sp. PJ23]MDX6807151.1 hypothetical protein [Terrihabitans sp. PJ23]
MQLGCGFICLALLSGTALAQTTADSQAALNNWGHEHLICAAYNAAVSECMLTNPSGKAGSDAYSEVSDVMFQRGYQASKAAGLSDKAIMAKAEIAMKEMMSTIEQSCANISVLFVQHAVSCKSLGENPGERFEQLKGGHSR